MHYKKHTLLKRLLIFFAVLGFKKCMTLPFLFLAILLLFCKALMMVRSASITSGAVQIRVWDLLI